jgi:hypothetical protein
MMIGLRGELGKHYGTTWLAAILHLSLDPDHGGYILFWSRE